MRILLLSQYFAPEVTAARVRVQAFAEGLAERGHEVEVICEVPNHPAGIVHEGYGGKAVDRRRLGDYDARYVWVYARPEKTTKTRLLFYGSYAAMAAAAGVASRRADVVLVSSPPLPAAAAAALVARRHRAPWVFDVRDLWPEAAVILGELRPGRAVRALEKLERRLYRDAAAIVTVTEPFRADIEAKAPGARVEVIPNGTTREFVAAAGLEVDRAELGMPSDRFVLTYAGNVGIAQGLEPAVDAAAQLGDGFELQIVGTGPRLEAIRERAAAAGAPVSFRGLVDPSEARRYMRASDALLVPLDSLPELQKFVPSKLFDCCAVGRPTIVSAAGEASRLAAAADAALCVPPGDAGALTAAVRRLREEPGLAAGLGERGHAFAEGYLRERQVGRLEQLLLSLI